MLFLQIHAIFTTINLLSKYRYYQRFNALFSRISFASISDSLRHPKTEDVF